MIKAPFGTERTMVWVLEMTTDDDVTEGLVGDKNREDVSEDNKVLPRGVIPV